MPFEIQLKKTPVGHAVSATRPGETVSVQVLEFTSTDDGEHFINRLEGLPTQILEILTPQQRIFPSQVDHLLAIIRPDNSATVYVNELPLLAKVRLIRCVETGTAIRKDDILNIERLELGKIPPDCGLLLLISSGWRKGLFYDFGPLSGRKEPRDYDPSVVFGQIFTHLTFQERFKISEEVWTALFAKTWYPFLGMGSGLIGKLISHAEAGWDLDELTDEVASRLHDALDSYLEQWRRRPVFEGHMDILGRVVDHFKAGDYISCTGLLYPRIEGLLRSHFKLSGKLWKATPAGLAKTAVEGVSIGSLIIPHRFEEYLNDVYFRTYDSRTSIPKELSRHTVSHGEALAESFNKKGATVGLLVIHQLGFILRESTT